MKSTPASPPHFLRGALLGLATVMALSVPLPMAHGQNIYVTNQFSFTVGKYTASGATVNASLISGLTDDGGIALSGSDLFVEHDQTTIDEYTTSGATVNASLITGLDVATDIAVVGSDLFVANYGGNTIGEYTTSGATVTPR
jgi:hypothetical protein